jgi:hypothetical protein
MLRSETDLLNCRVADKIEKIGRAITAKELADFLCVSEVTIFKHAAGRKNSFTSCRDVRAIRSESCDGMVAPRVKDSTLW